MNLIVSYFNISLMVFVFLCFLHTSGNDFSISENAKIKSFHHSAKILSKYKTAFIIIVEAD